MGILPILILLAASATFDQSYRAGLQALAQNRLAEAKSNLENAAAIEPGNSRVWVALAQTYKKMQEAAKANHAAEKAAQLARGDAQVFQILALFYRDSGQNLKLCDMQIEYAAAAPNDGHAPLYGLDCFLEANAPERVIEAGQRWPNRADVRVMMAKAYVATHQWALADKEFQSAIRLNPYDEGVHFDYANSLLQRHEFEQAITVIERARKNFDKSPQLELALGAASMGLRRFSEAAEAFQRTIALAPDLEQPYVFLGKILDQVPSKLPELTRLFMTFEQAHPDNYAGYLLHAKALLLQFPDRGRVAEELLRKACVLNPKASEPRFELGVLQERQQRFAEAAVEFEQAAALDVKDSATHYHLARVYNRLGKPELAKREREQHKRLLNPVPESK